MVRRSLNIVEQDEQDTSSSPPPDTKRGAQKRNALRSKHSETEQKRRCKINDRFQKLMDLIPDNNDQKRDKASFLLEVIRYIECLHEKLNMYEGSGRGWNPPELTKLTPWKINSGPVESFIHQSNLEELLSNNEDLDKTLLSNAQNLVESDLTGAVLHNPTDIPPMVTDQGLAPNMPSQLPMFMGGPVQPHQRSFADAEQLRQHPQPQLWRGTSFADDYSVPVFRTNEEELKSGNGEASISSAYSQGLLNSLTNALQSSGVDLSQANVSVQLDVRKRTNDESNAAVFSMKNHKNLDGFSSVAPVNPCENYAEPHKRFRGD